MTRNTLHDVARLSGVSYQTVSRVINNHPYVSEATRERVLQAITTLDYRPNRAAQSLAGARSQTLGMMTFGLNHYGPAQMVINIEQASRAAGYDLIFANLKDSDLDSLHTTLGYIRRWAVDGLLLITPIIGMRYAQVQALCAGTPLVLIGTGLGLDIPSIVVDQAAGARAVTEHLLALGHRDICAISGPLNWYDALERHESWLATLRTAGCEPGLSVEGTWTATSGYAAALHLLDAGGRFTALVTGNDQMAVGAVHALRERGLRVPEDVAIVGFDDIPEAAYLSPPLTTVRQDFGQLGRRGIEYLIERIHDPQAVPVQHVIAPQLVVRASSGAPTV